MKESLRTELRELYRQIYQDEAQAEQLLEKVENVLAKHTVEKKSGWLTEKDAVLITYGDTLQADGEPGLRTLKKFLDTHVKDAVSTVHILPMFPYTSDDGFSVVDYKQINPKLGTWKEVHDLNENYDLMFDAVINHISSKSEWFARFLEGEAPYKEFFIVSDPNSDYSSVTRPRALPLLTRFETKEGGKYLWTTFSEDQIDLNYKSIDLYAQILDILLFYAEEGARMIRLDAIGFLWKELGTSCMHLPNTHKVIQSFRKILDVCAPGTLLITETNVPHKENISYFGTGKEKEAQLVYQFPLPPLVLFSVIKGDCTKLMKWAAGLEEPRKGTSYFNFLSSHDGIGIRPVEGILTEEERGELVRATLKNGGEVSYKDNGDGTRSPYELNINYQDALASPEESDERRRKKFLAAETILLSLQGLPAVYMHSLLGSRNDYYGKTVSGIPRRINREQLEIQELEERLAKESSRSLIFDEMIRRLNIRKEHPAFAPDAAQKVILTNPSVFQIKRMAQEEVIAVYINVSNKRQRLERQTVNGIDLLTGKKIEESFELDAYEAVWLLEK